MRDGPNKNQLSRRDVLKLARVAVPGLFAAVYGVDKYTNGFITTNLRKAIEDPDYRERLIETIKRGSIDDKLRLEYQERTRKYSEVCGLGEPLNLQEEVLNAGFVEYQIRPFITNGEQSNNLLLIGQIGKNVKVYETVFEPNNEKCLTQTMQKKGEFINIPSSYAGIRNVGIYSEFITEEGKKIECAQDTIEDAYGALILLKDGSVRAVDRGEILKYMAGWNCKAIQSYGVAICSNTLDMDLSSLDKTEYNDGRNAAISRNQSCFIATFSDSVTKREETIIISQYQQQDIKTGMLTGDNWEIGISMEQAASICEQLALEGKYDKFMLLGPDPNRSHSKLNAPGDLGNTTYLRQYTYGEEVFFDERSKDIDKGPSYQVPIFLGIELKKPNSENNAIKRR